MSIDLSNEYIQELIKSYKSALKRLYDEEPETIKIIEEMKDYSIVIDMMNDAIQYKDHQMKAKILYKKYNNSKNKKYTIEQCKKWHEKLPKEECKECNSIECENKKEADQH